MKITSIQHRTAPSASDVQQFLSEVESAVDEAVQRFGVMRFAESLTFASEVRDELPMAA